MRVKRHLASISSHLFATTIASRDRGVPRAIRDRGARSSRIASRAVEGLERRVLLSAAVSAAAPAPVPAAPANDVPPTLLAIQLATPNDPVTSGPDVSFTVTFSEPVTGVDSSDFQPNLVSGVTSSSLSVLPVTSSVYTVTLGGVSGTGQAGIKLIDNGSIIDAAGNRLQPGRLTPFAPPVLLPSIPQAPGGISVADINGDGKPDLVANYAYTGAIGVQLGNGDGTFPAPTTVPAGGTPGIFSNVTLADMNGDGKLDAVVAHPDSNSVALLLGNGDGTFSAPETFAAGSGAESTAAADVNGDGRPDVVVANLYGNSVNVLLGNGDGTFVPGQTFATGALPMDLHATDLNGDGKADLVYVNLNDSVGVMLGNGDGTFQAQKTFVPAAPNVISVDVGDMNRDGIPDLVSNTNSGESGELLGNGDGTFSTGPSVLFSGRGHMSKIADINNDGIPDIVGNSGNPQLPSLGVSFGNADGTLSPPATFAYAARIISDEHFITVADLNGDGRPDVLTGNRVNEFLSAPNANATGPLYQVIPYLNTINGSGPDNIVQLQLEPDLAHIDWTLFNTAGDVPTSGRLAINDPGGLTINASPDGATQLTFGQNALPKTLHLNGTFDWPTNDQFLFSIPGTTLDVGRSTLYVTYTSAASDPVAAIRAALASGYSKGSWTGTGDNSTTGAITSSAAAQDPAHLSVGYADSADGTGINTTPDSVEIKFARAGDANLDGAVNSADATILSQNFRQPGKVNWDEGNFNYDDTIDHADLKILLKNFDRGPTASASLTDSGDSTDPLTLLRSKRDQK